MLGLLFLGSVGKMKMIKNRNKNKKRESLKKILLKHLGEKRAAKYFTLSLIDKSKKKDPETLIKIYQYAIESLTAGDLLGCLNNIILGIQIERKNISLLDLCRTILLGLNQRLLREDIIKFSQKYSFNLREARKIIKNSLKDLENKLSQNKREILVVEKELSVNTNAFQLIKKTKLSKQLDFLENELYRLQGDSEVNKSELKRAETLLKNQEYAIVILIVTKFGFAE